MECVNNCSSFQIYQDEDEKNGKTCGSRIVTVIINTGCGIIAAICGIVAIVSLLFTLPSYVALRLIDQYRGIKFKGIMPEDDSALSQFPILATLILVRFTEKFGELAFSGKSDSTKSNI